MSVVYRTADRSELTPGNIILTAGYAHRHTFNLAVTELERIPDLAYVLRLPELEVRNRTYPETFRSTHGCTFVDFAGASVPLVLLNARYRRVAPAALEGRPFHDMLSEHRLLPFDADTGTMLIANCHECDQSLGWTVVRSFHRCKCGADLRHAPPAPMPPEFLNGARAMASLLDPRPSIHAASISALPALLRSLNRGSIFEIGWQTAIAVGFAERPKANAANWPVGDKLRTLDLTARLLADWPTSAEAAFSSLPSIERRRAAVTNLAALARSTRVPDEVRTGIRAILPDRTPSTRIASAGRPHGLNLTDAERRARRDAYATTQRDGTIVGDDVASSVSMNQACHILGKAIGETSRMLSTLEPIDTYGSHKGRRRWPRAEIMRIADILEYREPIDAFSYRTGIPHHGIEQMICLDLIQQLDDPAVVAGHKVRQLDQRSIDTFVELLWSARSAFLPEGWISFVAAMRAIGGREKPWGPAFAMMLKGDTLPFAWRRAGDSTGVAIDDIFVPREARELFQAAVFSKADYPNFNFDELLTARDATKLLNIHDNKFAKIRKDHFAHAVAPDGRLAAEAVIDAGRNWVSPGELGARTGRTPYDCFQELAKTQLQRTLLGWPRDAAEARMKLTDDRG
jgi:hypothetical protein